MRFTTWFKRLDRRGDLPRGDGSRGEVVLWPDTFTNHLSPAIGVAAVEVLEAAGFTVRIPRAGALLRPDVDLHRTARHRQEGAAPDGDRAGPLHVRRHPGGRAGAELHGRLPGRRTRPLPRGPRRRAADRADEDARRAAARAGARLAAAAGSTARPSSRCTATSTPILGEHADVELLKRAGMDADVLDSGCCGLAGNFGFEAGHYDVSMACAEDGPAPRRAVGVRGHPDGRGRLQLPDAGRAERRAQGLRPPGDARCTSRRCWRRPCEPPDPLADHANRVDHANSDGRRSRRLEETDMALTVGGYLLSRLRDWGIEHVFAFPGDGINGILAAWTDESLHAPAFVQARHEEMAAFEAVGLREVRGASRAGPAPGRRLHGHLGPGGDPPAQRALRRQARPRPGRGDRRADGAQRDGRLLPAGGRPRLALQGRRRRLRADGDGAGAAAERARPGDPDRDRRSRRRRRSSSRPTCRSSSTPRPGTRSRRSRRAWASRGRRSTPTRRGVRRAAEILNAG